MKELCPLTPEQLACAEDRLLHPPSGGRIEAAKKYGIDLMSLIEHLRLTPAERGMKPQVASMKLEKCAELLAGVPDAV